MSLFEDEMSPSSKTWGVTKSTVVEEIVLQPGEYHFGDQNTRMRTLLGSCVAITLWHPHLLIGGMCHFLLPSRVREKRDALDGKYADEVIQLLLDEIKMKNTYPSEYDAKIFGGGNMFPGLKGKYEKHIGRKNVEVGCSLITTCGMKYKASDVGGEFHRNIIFDVWNGQVWVNVNSARNHDEYT